MLPFQEIIFPELVRDVQNIYHEHIDRIEFQPLPIMKKEGIIGVGIKDTIEFTEINRLRNKYPFLDKHFLIFKLRPGFATEIHLDGHPEVSYIKQRPLSINIPISGCNKNGITEFYSNSEDDFYMEKRFNVRVTKPGIVPSKTVEYALLENPIIANTQVPHRVNNLNNTEYRITVSWTTDLSWDWNAALEYFKERIKCQNVIN
jgi:hypothetical protein